MIQAIIEFFKTGLFSIGGGLATIPFLKEMSIRYGWFSLDLLKTMINVAESTPGPIGVNTATYVGYSMFGLFGGIITTLSLIAPSIIIILIVATILDKFKNSKLVDNIFKAIRPASLGLILFAVSDIFLNTLFNQDTFINIKEMILYLVALFITIKFKKIHPIIVIIFCALMGILFAF